MIDKTFEELSDADQRLLLWLSEKLKTVDRISKEIDRHLSAVNSMLGTMNLELESFKLMAQTSPLLLEALSEAFRTAESDAEKLSARRDGVLALKQ